MVPVSFKSQAPAVGAEQPRTRRPMAEQPEWCSWQEEKGTQGGISTWFNSRQYKYRKFCMAGDNGEKPAAELVP